MKSTSISEEEGVCRQNISGYKEAKTPSATHKRLLCRQENEVEKCLGKSKEKKMWRENTLVLTKKKT